MSLFYFVLIVLFAPQITHARRGVYCESVNVDCPEDHRVFISGSGYDFTGVKLAQRYICVGAYTMTCNRGEDDGGCFPEHATVQDVNGTRISFKDLKVGDQILDGVGDVTVVQGWMHREPENRMKTVIINGVLEVSVDHLISTPTGYVFAGKLKPGDEVMAGEDTLSIT